MKKKIKELTKKDIQKICKHYGGGYGKCNPNCVLYRLAPNRPRLCSNMFFNKEEQEYREREIDLDEIAL